MQIIVRRFFFLIVLLAAFPAMAGRIGFLNTEQAIRTVKEGQRQMQALDAWALPSTVLAPLLPHDAPPPSR